MASDSRYGATVPRSDKGVDDLPETVRKFDSLPKERIVKAFQKLRELYVHDVHPAKQKKLFECEDEDVKLLIMEYGVLEHFKTADSHRVAISAVHKLMKCAGIKEALASEMEERVRLHDMSKYDYEEASGYTHKWVHSADTPQWSVALKHHYQHNAHHPEYFGEKEMGTKMDIAESVVDMMAVRFERILKALDKTLEDKTLSITKLMSIEVFYLKRYSEDDGKQARAFWEAWRDNMIQVLKDKPTAFSEWESSYDRKLVE